MEGKTADEVYLLLVDTSVRVTLCILLSKISKQPLNYKIIQLNKSFKKKVINESWGILFFQYIQAKQQLPWLSTEANVRCQI